MANADFARVRRFEKIDSYSAIVPHENPLHQYFLLISQQRLTELLEALEKLGLTGDIAIFVLSSLQNLEARI